MKKQYLLFLTVISFTLFTIPAFSQWVHTNGPYGGSVHCFAFSPDGSKIFAGTWGGGVFLSTNNGTNWIYRGLPNAAIKSIAITPDGTKIFAGSYAWISGVFLSTDEGLNWVSVSNGLQNSSVNTLAISPDGTKIFAGTKENGIFISTNNGSSWISINNGLTNTNINTIKINQDGNKIFAGTLGGGIFLSTDNGTNWSAVNNGLTNLYVNSLVIKPDGTELFTSVGPDSAIIGGESWKSQLFHSTDNGSSWTAIDMGFTNLEVNSLLISPDGTKIFVGTWWNRGVFVSTNNGLSWSSTNDGLNAPYLSPPNIFTLAFSPNGTDIFIGTHCNGIFLSKNHGLSWSEVNNGLINNFVWAFSFSHSENYILAGTDIGVFRSTDNGSNWTPSNNGLDAGFVTSFATNLESTSLFASTSGWGRGVYISNDSGISWTAVDNGLTNYWVTSLAVSGINLFAGTDGAGVFLSTNNGLSWTTVNDGLSNKYISSLKITSSGTDLYAGTKGGGVFHFSSDSQTWMEINNGLPNKNINSIVVNADGSKIFAAVSGEGLYLSTNNGVSWNEINNGLFPNPDMNSLAITPDGMKVFAGTFYSGIFLSLDNGENWTQINDGLENLVINSIAINTDGTTIFVSTAGGVYRRPISEFNYYTVITSSDPLDGGITSGAGIYNLGKNVTVTAQANNGFEFTNWTENGTVVSTDANYTFTINENRELVANFTEINNSVLFDGVNGRIRVLDSNAPNPTAFQINGTAISVEAWVFPMDYPRADLGNTIVARTLNTNYSEPWTSYRLWINHSNGVSLPAFSISNGIPGNTVTVQAPDDIPSFQWVHLAATYDGLVMRLYVNGELKAQVNTSISINSANGIGFYIGRFLYDGFLGVIDDVRLWNIARSESDIISNMNKVLHGNEYGLAGYWNVDIKSLINGQYLAFDKTQNHNDLIFQSNTPIIPFIPLKTYESPTFNINPLSINIGTLEQGSTSPSSILTITNTGNSPLIGILSLESSNINLLGNIVFFAEGGQAIDIGISITPQISGQINESLTMRSNTATSSFINISGTSVPLGLFDVNNLSMWVQRNGIFAYNPMIESSGLEWPKGSGKTAVYSSGIWIGAIVDGDIRTSSSYYRSEFAPGPIINGIPSDPNDFTYRVYKIQNGDNAGNNPDYASWPSNLGAPVNSDGSPKIIGDQTLFAVYNDLNPANRFLGSTPLGVEVQQTIFGFNQSGPLSNTVFLRFKIINRSPKTWTNTFISIWNDADLGDAGDDLTAVDTSRNLGFIYNGSDNDQVYGVSPPAAGYKILKGAFFTKPIQGFSYFTQSVPKDPNNSTQIYNVMKGFMIDGTPYIDPLTQTSTKFPLSGDPVSSQGWLDPTPHDKRFLLTTGPFNLEPGQSKEIYAAIVLAQGSSNLNSVTVLKSASDEIQNLFNTGQIFGGALENVSSINVPEGITDSLNDISNSGAVITVTGGSSGNLVEIASYIDSPPGVQTISSPNISGVGKYIVVDIQGEVSWPIPIRIYYTRNDLLQAGIVESDLQGIYYWQGSTNLWLLYSNSGSDDQGRGPSTTWVDTTNATINSVHYEGYVAANAYHLAQLIIGAKKKTISERYTGTSAFIQALPDNAFKNPADTRRKQLIKMLEQSKSKYNSGNLKNAAQYLEQNVLNHLTSNNKSGNDLWVTDATACKTLIRMINELIDLLNRPQLLGKMIESELNVLDHIEIPTKYELSQNYPNPFNPITKIRFALPFDCYTKLTIYDILGREMETIINDNLSAGYHEVNFNGFYLPSGVYIYKLQAGEFISIKKMLLLK